MCYAGVSIACHGKHFYRQHKQHTHYIAAENDMQTLSDLAAIVFY